jgi:hypothetical protein
LPDLTDRGILAARPDARGLLRPQAPPLFGELCAVPQPSDAPTTSRFSSAYAAAAVIFLNTVVLILVLEVALRLAEPLYRTARYELQEWRHGPSLQAALPGLSKAARRQLHREFAEANRLVYAPWVQFVTADFAGDHLNLHDRRRANGTSDYDWKTALPSDEHFDVYVFGGSTTQGAGVPDRDTIPAWLERLAGPGVVRVFNYGHGYWFSRQESGLLDTLLRDGHRPDAAIFIDGLNDTVQPGSSYSGVPFFTAKVEDLFDDQAIVAKLLSSSAIAKMLRHFRLFDLARHKSLYQLPPGVSLADAGQRIVSNYVRNLEHTSHLCDDYEVACYFFWQPVPFHRYANPSDSLSLQGTELPVVTWVYDHIDAATREVPNFANLSGVLEDHDGQGYVDGFHYSSAAGRRIAEHILARIELD